MIYSNEEKVDRNGFKSTGVKNSKAGSRVLIPLDIQVKISKIARQLQKQHTPNVNLEVNESVESFCVKKGDAENKTTLQKKYEFFAFPRRVKVNETDKLSKTQQVDQIQQTNKSDSNDEITKELAKIIK